jgi:UDP-3-O-[3-hydroxymyristoyl] glucosamine N-acyltransferase
MKFSAQQIAEALRGTVDGDVNITVSNLSKIEEGKPGTLSFLANPVYEKYIYDTEASIVIVSNDFKPEKEIKSTLIRVEDPYASFAHLLELYQQSKQKKSGISPKAHIDESAKVGNNAYIAEFTVIGENTTIGDNCIIYSNVTIGDNVKIGDNVTLFAGVKIYDECIIGNNCTLHAGVVIGSDGFGFAPQQDADFKKIPQIGNVVIEDKVEIGANTIIDRATLGSTIIKRGVKLDNLIQIAHNVIIGENTVIAAQTGISGSTKIGKNCMIGGQVGIIGHLIIADEVKISAQSGIGKSITEKGTIVEGSPAFNARNFQKSYIHFRNLDRLIKRVNDLEHKVKKVNQF